MHGPSSYFWAMNENRTLVHENALASAESLAARLDTAGHLVTGLIPRGYEIYLRLLNPIEHRDGSMSSWSDAWVANGITPSPWMQWDELIAMGDAVLPDVDGEPGMGSPHPLLARSLIQALALEHDLTQPHRFAVWAGYDGQGHKPAVAFSSQSREMVLYSGPLINDGEPLLPTTGTGRIPMYWWPDDLSWCVGQDVFARSLLVGCDLPTALAILANPQLDAYRVRNDQQALVEDF